MSNKLKALLVSAGSVAGMVGSAVFVAVCHAQSVITVASATATYSDGMAGFGQAVLSVLEILIPTVLTIFAIVWAVRKTKGLVR